MNVPNGDTRSQDFVMLTPRVLRPYVSLSKLVRPQASIIQVEGHLTPDGMLLRTFRSFCDEETQAETEFSLLLMSDSVFTRSNQRHTFEERTLRAYVVPSSSSSSSRLSSSSTVVDTRRFEYKCKVYSSVASPEREFSVEIAEIA